MFFPLASQAEDALFGQEDELHGALIGILYDFKIDQQRNSTDMNPNKYSEVIDAFLISGWDESVLNRYYRAARPLYATQIFIPMMSANAAPKAFGVAATVEPRLWAVHYKGQVSPPRDGRFRFAGYADDVIAVAVNGKLVLLQGRRDMINPMKVEWSSEDGQGMKAGNGHLLYGDWLDLKAATPVDIDILIGERPGGDMGAFLFYQEYGVNYSMQDDHPVLPVFQLAEAPIPEADGRRSSPYAPPTETWIAVP